LSRCAADLPEVAAVIAAVRHGHAMLPAHGPIDSLAAAHQKIRAETFTGYGAQRGVLRKMEGTAQGLPGSCGLNKISREEHMLRIVAVIGALAVGGTAVWAQNAAGIAARKETMKAFGVRPRRRA
jgi:hypothetical protein